MSSVIWTIGHSTRPIEEFLALLDTYGIERLVDVRAIPASRRYPQYNANALHRALADAEIAYLWLPALGGRRRPHPNSPNTGWRNASFRGYADYMQTQPFWAALDTLLASASCTAIMCAEAVPWRCHRSLIADALVMRGREVRHILSRTQASPHALTAFAEMRDGRLVYPSPARPPSPSEDPAPRLF